MSNLLEQSKRIECKVRTFSSVAILCLLFGCCVCAENVWLVLFGVCVVSSDGEDNVWLLGQGEGFA